MKLDLQFCYAGRQGNIPGTRTVLHIEVLIKWVSADEVPMNPETIGIPLAVTQSITRRVEELLMYSLPFAVGE